MQQASRQLTVLDKLCLGIDRALQALTHDSTFPLVERVNPADNIVENTLTDAERRHSAGLMRVNHVGEVCAQALYQGQALTARLAGTREAMQQAAIEEHDHLRWCAQRLQQLNSHTSYLNPLWYVGAFSIGVIAGMVGDKWSLGFVAETEHQVVVHLEGHKVKLAKADQKSHAIIDQMAIDEAEHAAMAKQAGAAELPQAAKSLMRLSAKVMTTTAYFV